MTLVVLISALLVAYLLTACVRRYALATRLLDIPNQRSSHAQPTPRGGGLSIVITMTVGVLSLWLKNAVDTQLVLAIVGGGLTIAVVGFMDDRGALSVTVRMIVHIVAAVWALYVLGGLPALQIGDRLVDLGILGDIIGVFAIIWTLNLFNFMDGIDGLAASEACFVNGSVVIIAWWMGSSQSLSLASLLLASASFGFLLWNWPPAKIFMGDVGSSYLGYVIAVLAIATARENPAALFVWLTLGGVFFVDATMTLIRRLIRCERVHEAHRSHAYQWLSRRWNSHLLVTLLVMFVNIFWLFPLAWVCVRFPGNAWWITLFSLSPLVALALVAGAGRRE